MSYEFPLYLDTEEGRPPWVIEAGYMKAHGHGFVLAPVAGCAACRSENRMSLNNKDHFVAVLTAAETKGLLPKGKTADILENYPFLVDEIEAQAKSDEPVPFTPESDDLKTQPSAPVDHDALDEKTKKRTLKV